MLGVEVLFGVPPAAGLSLIRIEGSGAGGGGDMTQLSFIISCFSVFAATEKYNS